MGRQDGRAKSNQSQIGLSQGVFMEDVGLDMDTWNGGDWTAREEEGM